MRTNNLVKYILVAFVTIVSLSVSAQLPVSRNKLIQPKHKVVAQVKNVNNTNSDGVSRIEVYLLSTPSTSSRIDSVTLVNNNRRFTASDIDGVDFNRYFQWEDNGEILVEVDFPKQQKFGKDASVIFHTVYGDVSAPVKTVKVKGGSKR